ncbi:hypothetical protein ACFZAR_05325 [Streptomyces sp. NPDC008222]|uniref:hypothetical protein n=1 Tax=Streptomyces sp. NPDC008222 TaxID=3364820 RepID=UPI0036E90B77
MSERREIRVVLQPAGFVPHESRYSHTDIDGDRLLISTAVMPGNVPGVYFRTDPNGSSVPLADLPALIAQLQVIADAAQAEADEAGASDD